MIHFSKLKQVTLPTHVGVVSFQTRPSQYILEEPFNVYPGLQKNITAAFLLLNIPIPFLGLKGFLQPGPIMIHQIKSFNRFVPNENITIVSFFS